jgi:hypothetical protein
MILCVAGQQECVTLRYVIQAQASGRHAQGGISWEFNVNVYMLPNVSQASKVGG